jgi:4-diphosphocytidyl-2-C-methyl-D-erythritol kinase
MKSVKLRSLAKINLDLRILHKRDDGFHELRTVFQTISLADTIEIEYEKSRHTELTIEGSVDIPDNLILRAAGAYLDAARLSARIHFRLTKKIPMGGGLGGGSSNAAAVLLALPVLAGKRVDIEQIAAGLGSDVPFFLHGGTMLALGRGEELYPLPDVIEEPILVVSSGLHVATGPAYAALGRGLTFTGSSTKINGFREFVRALGSQRRATLASALSENDFEAVVFQQYPKLKTILGKLSKSGAAGVRRPFVRMTGSGSAIFGLFESNEDRERARKVLDGESGLHVTSSRLVSRRAYQRLWRRQLRDHVIPGDDLWPPRSRYEG